MKKFVILLMFIFAVSTNNIIVAQETAKKDSLPAPVIEKKEPTPTVAPAVEEKKEMACPHCTKDKKCAMHSKSEMKEADCKMCSKDKKCDMHSKAEMKEADCKNCMDDKKCEMNKKKATSKKKTSPAKKVTPKK